MPDMKIDPRTGLEHLASPGRRGNAAGDAGVQLELRPWPAIVSVLAHRRRTAQLQQVARSALGIELPDKPVRTAAGDLAMVWAGPEQWLVVAEGSSAELEGRLAAAFEGLAAVIDQSDARLLVRIAGPRARDTLAKGLPIDLHPESFKCNDAALTAIGYTGVHIWQVDDLPAFEIAVARSYAADLWRFLLHAGAEFGVEIASHRAGS